MGELYEEEATTITTSNYAGSYNTQNATRLRDKDDDAELNAMVGDSCSRCAVGRTRRLLPCLCSLTAFPSRSSLLVPKLATARSDREEKFISRGHNFHAELTH
ncbi:Hypothetical protein SMAX5B_004161 [Scophthalmus maximus]|uniref:Uncharacterized protein n=1 Tax=Scophthalmus maximus TaxID=52904 RepID=A0A2U9B8U7_SCOMX|nr:Hypothetical protein SMAX5B_004161 [Scophthalmus maximus]